MSELDVRKFSHEELEARILQLEAERVGDMAFGCHARSAPAGKGTPGFGSGLNVRLQASLAGVNPGQ